jgi:hypothetical protein
LTIPTDAPVDKATAESAAKSDAPAPKSDIESAQAAQDASVKPKKVKKDRPVKKRVKDKDSHKEKEKDNDKEKDKEPGSRIRRVKKEPTVSASDSAADPKDSPRASLTESGRDTLRASRSEAKDSPREATETKDTPRTEKQVPQVAEVAPTPPETIPEEGTRRTLWRLLVWITD